MENDKADLNENTITFRNKNIIIEYKNDWIVECLG